MNRRAFLFKVPAAVAAVAAPQVVRAALTVVAVDVPAKTVTVASGALTEQIMIDALRRMDHAADHAAKRPGTFIVHPAYHRYLKETACLRPSKRS